MEGKNKIGKIKEAIKHNKKLAEGHQGGYERKENEWGLGGIYDSSLENFAYTLNASLPKDYEVSPINLKVERLKRYIEETLSKKEKPNLTAVEFGGPGSQLFTGFTKNFFKKTAGICLKDIRDEKQKQNDETNKHFVITEDMLNPQSDKLSEKITQILGVNKTDLIISRMDGPLDSINKHPTILDRIIRNWYNILNENGLMFIQFDSLSHRKPPINTMVEQWSDIIRKKFTEIDIQIDGGVMRLHKKIGAPEELPRSSELFRE